jgi:type I restriction enzyme M protein
MLTAETKRRIDACRDVLVGKLPLPTDQVELITLALIYKFMDDLDEESVKLGGKRSFFVKELAPYRWRALMSQTISADERMTLFAGGVEALGHPKKAAHLPGLFRDIFRNAFLKFRDGRILTMFLGEVNGFEYSHSEELGNAFEYLLQCMGTQGENGQFRTPRHIIDFMVACLEPRPTDKILDPACGTGGFLVSAFKYILAKHTDGHGRGGRGGREIPGGLLSHEQRQQVYRNLTGYDITDLMVKLSKVNLFLHGFPDPAIHIYDTLSNDARWHEKADLILANPPFMTPKGGVTPHTKFRIAAKKAEVLFTDYIAEHLTPDGRGGVIVPNGIVATTQNAYVKLRRFLVEDSLVAVVSLPAGVFKPYSGVKTSILLLDKKLARTAKEILFLKITADGFDLGDKRTPIEANDLPEAERVVKLWLAGKLKEGTESAVAWKAVEKKELLAHRSLSLQSEGLFGDKVVEVSDHEEVPLGELCEILDSQRRPITKSDRKPGPIPYYGATGVVDYVEGFLFDEPLVLIGEDGAKWGAGEQSAFAISGKTWVNNHAHVLRPNRSRILDTFLIAILNRLDLMPYVTGVTVPKLNQANLREIPIPLPPLEEQRRIVAEIEGYQKVLDGARQILAGYRVDIEPDPDWPVVPLGEVLNFVGRRHAQGRQVHLPHVRRAFHPQPERALGFMRLFRRRLHFVGDSRRDEPHRRQAVGRVSEHHRRVHRSQRALHRDARGERESARRHPSPERQAAPCFPHALPHQLVHAAQHHDGANRRIARGVELPTNQRPRNPPAAAGGATADRGGTGRGGGADGGGASAAPPLRGQNPTGAGAGVGRRR